MSTDWVKSSRSSGGSDNCVEVRLAPDAIGVRDSKERSGPVLVVPSAAWSTFVAAAKSGHLDSPA